MEMYARLNTEYRGTDFEIGEIVRVLSLIPTSDLFLPVIKRGVMRFIDSFLLDIIMSDGICECGGHMNKASSHRSSEWVYLCNSCRNVINGKEVG